MTSSAAFVSAPAGPGVVQFGKSAVSIVCLAIVVVFVGYQYGMSDVLRNLQQLSVAATAFVSVALLANALTAALRFQVMAADAGYRISFRTAMAAVSVGSLAGAVFFQIAGQLMARGLLMRNSGVPLAAVVSVTLYERIVAMAVSWLIALVGALALFGSIHLDLNLGGDDLVKIACGFAAAAAGAALLGFGSSAARTIRPLLTRRSVARAANIAALTVLVQLPMMAAYVAVAHEFSPQQPVADLAAASAVIMFAASMPVSLAGWGVREMSAIAVFGTIGMTASAALTAAVVIGAGSLLAMGVVFAVSFGDARQKPSKTNAKAEPPFDYWQALCWILPLAAAVAVLFQIYIPTGSGLLNVNLADPVAILAGSLFLVKAIKDRQWPRWRVDYVNVSAVVATVALTGSLLIGAARFGWTDWALINRFAGWFVLLAFAATGALLTAEGGERALRIVVLTYVGATAGIAVIEDALVYVNALVTPLPAHLVQPGNAVAFSQNRNLFAFQLVTAAAGAMVMMRGGLRTAVLALLLVTFWFAGSRSGWISVTCILAASLYFRFATVRELAFAIAAAVVLILVVDHPSFHLADSPQPSPLSRIVPAEVSTQERIQSMVGGWKLFVEHPIFGGGLGAFHNQRIPSSLNGIPLVIHSTALWLLAELGLIGFLVFAVPGVYVWFTQWRRASREPAAALVTLCFLGLAVMSGPADMLYQRTFWLLAGAALTAPRTDTRVDLAGSG